MNPGLAADWTQAEGFFIASTDMVDHDKRPNLLVEEPATMTA
jgi:hypothetical protein